MTCPVINGWMIIYTQVGIDTMFDDLHNTLEHSGDGGNRFHTLIQGLREEVESLSRKGHHWESYNVDQLVCIVQ